MIPPDTNMNTRNDKSEKRFSFENKNSQKRNSYGKIAANPY